MTRFVEGLFLEVRIRNASNDGVQLAMRWGGIAIVAALAIWAGVYGLKGLKKKK